MSERAAVEQPVLIQLAIQGGGAKLAALLAVMEAVQEAEQRGAIQVTRIAGTSAGAIAGALFASGVPLVQIRQALQAITAQERSRMFPAVGTITAAARLMSNRPLWSSDQLRKLLVRLLSLNECRVRTLGDIRDRGIDLRIISSDLRNAQQHIFADPSDNLVNALIESAAIPYFYRTWPNQDGVLLVDGGICQNLPSEVLRKREQEHPGGGAIVGVTFEELTVNEAPTNLVSFSKALLETAMNSSVLRARDHVKWPLLVRTRIGTFDFKTAFTDGLGDSYENVRTRAAADLRHIIDEERQEKLALSTTPPVEHKVKFELWKQTPEWMKTQLGEIYTNQHASRLFKYHHASMTVQANCLVEDDGIFSKLPDAVENRMIFAPEGEPVFCLRMGVDSASTNDANLIADPIWSIVDRHGIQANATPMPISSVVAGKRSFLLFFSPPLPPDADGRAPYSLRVTDWVRDAMRPLRENGVDEVVLNNHRASGTIPRVDLVLFVPTSFEAVLVAHESKSAVPGRSMTQEELLAYSPPPGFKPLGWVGNDVPGGNSFAVRVLKVSSKVGDTPNARNA
jgi:NTE family protein